MQILEVDPSYFNYNIYTQEKLQETKKHLELNKNTLDLIEQICHNYKFDQSVFQKAAFFYNRVVILTELKNKHKNPDLPQKLGFDCHLFAVASLFLVTKINDLNNRINLSYLTNSFLVQSYKLKQNLLEREDRLQNESQIDEFIKNIETKKKLKYTQSIQLAEQKLLKKIGFDFNIEVADPYIRYFLCQRQFNISQEKKKPLEIQILDISKDIYKTTLCNYFHPLVITIAVIMESLEKMQIDINLPQILEFFEEVTYDNIEEEVNLLRKGYFEIQLILNDNKKLSERLPEDQIQQLNQQVNSMEIENHNNFDEEEQYSDDGF